MARFQLLAITGALYYTTSPQAVGGQQASKSLNSRNPLAQLSLSRNTAHDNVTPAQRIWQILNPSEGSLVHIRIESPTILVLGNADTETLDNMTADTEKPTRPRIPRLWSRTVRPIIWLLKTFVFPITATTVALYGLLLYLLKDAELLEAQRNAPEPDSPSGDEVSTAESGISFSTLPRAFATDVELIASSEDGKIVITVGLRNELVVWRTETDRKSTRLNSSHSGESRMPSSA